MELSKGLIGVCLSVSLIVCNSCHKMPNTARSVVASQVKKNNVAAVTQPNVQADIGFFDAVLPDRLGKPWVSVSGTGTANLTSSTGGKRSITTKVIGTRALLYKAGVPCLKLEAPWIEADQATGRVRASGKVLATTIDSSGAGLRKVQSDTIVWDVKRDTLHGEGNVRFYDSGSFDIPATAFTADTVLDRVEIFNSSKPLAGWWK